MTLVVAIDGPAGTGKSSVSRMAAHKLGLIYVDTGAIYRGLAYLVAKNNIDPFDIKSLVDLAKKLNVVVDEDSLCTKIIVNGLNIESKLRSEKISRLSSVVSQHKEVREALLNVQRDLVGKVSKGAIFEGRDIGTVVFPHAPLKIFVTASSETRAKRRFAQVKDEREGITLDEVLQSIKKRDDRDRNRLNSPMHKADDASVIDTSAMTLEQVLDQTLDLIEKTQAKMGKGQKLW